MSIPLAFLPDFPPPVCSPDWDRMFTPEKDVGEPITLAGPRLSLEGTLGSNPQPSPKVVYKLSSSPQVRGQVSLPSAVRSTVESQVRETILVLGGYGAYPAEARGVKSNDEATTILNNEKE